MKAIKSLDVASVMVYGFWLVAIWTLVFGFYHWVLGWAFGAQSWFIDMDIVNWTEYTVKTFLGVFWRMFVNGLGGAFVGMIIAVFYNASAGVMGGIKVELGDSDKKQ